MKKVLDIIIVILIVGVTAWLTIITTIWIGMISN